MATQWLREFRRTDLQFDHVLQRGGFNVYKLLVRNEEEVDSIMDSLVEMDALVERDGNQIAIAALRKSAG